MNKKFITKIVEEKNLIFRIEKPSSHSEAPPERKTNLREKLGGLKEEIKNRRIEKESQRLEEISRYAEAGEVGLLETIDLIRIFRIYVVFKAGIRAYFLNAKKKINTFKKMLSDFEENFEPEKFEKFLREREAFEKSHAEREENIIKYINRYLEEERSSSNISEEEFIKGIQTIT